MLRFIQLDTNSYYTTITLNITGDYFTKKTYISIVKHTTLETFYGRNIHISNGN